MTLDLLDSINLNRVGWMTIYSFNFLNGTDYSPFS